MLNACEIAYLRLFLETSQFKDVLFPLEYHTPVGCTLEISDFRIVDFSSVDTVLIGSFSPTLYLLFIPHISAKNLHQVLMTLGNTPEFRISRKIPLEFFTMKYAALSDLN